MMYLKSPPAAGQGGVGAGKLRFGSGRAAPPFGRPSRLAVGGTPMHAKRHCINRPPNGHFTLEAAIPQFPSIGAEVRREGNRVAFTGVVVGRGNREVLKQRLRPAVHVRLRQ